MPTTQSTTQQNEHASPTQHLSPPRRTTANLYGMLLRKTKNKTYGAFRSSFNASRTHPQKDAGLTTETTSPDDHNRRTPRMGSVSRVIQPSNSFYFSPQNSWDNSRAVLAREQNFQEDHDNDVEDVIAGVESSIRKVIICCGVFIAGTIMPEYAGHVRKLLEFSLVAWGTCLAIIGLVWFQKMQHGKSYEKGVEGASGVPDLTAPPDIQRTIVLSTDQSTEIMRVSSDSLRQDDFVLRRIPSSDEADDARKAIKKLTPSKAPKPRAFMPPHLKQLEDLYIMMDGKRLSPNGATVKIETDMFVGEMLLMFRTSDVDEPPPMDGLEDPMCTYFRGKQRRFEWQWQIKLKKVPSGDLYVGCELDEPPAMGMIQRALVNTALKFVKKTNQGFGYYFSDSSDSPSYLSFPVGTSMDRLVATKSGGKVPQLGKEIFEDADTMRKRKRGGQIEWNTEDTYTMALWSAYFDWIEWQILNFPGIRPFSATSVAGVQPIRVNLYTIRTGGDEVAIENPPRDVLFALEVSNMTKAALGEDAKAWRAKRASSTEVRALNYDDIEHVVQNVDADENSDNEDDDADMELLDVNMEQLHSLESSNYVTSGTYLSLQEAPGSFLASGGGYALLQSSSTSVIVLEKLFRSRKAFSYIQKSGIMSDPQMVIRNGDLVRVKLVNLSTNTTKYLRIHRGWWLRWTSNRPTKTSSFYISTNDPEATPLSLGVPFSLRSRKWSNYHVGVCHESSAKFGGRMLAMFKAGKSAAEEEPTIEGDDEEDPIEEDDDKDFVAEKPVSTTIPLLLRAETVKSAEAESPSPSKRSSRQRTQGEGNDQSPLNSLPSDLISRTHYEVDCPVWLEFMNRATRSTQLVYAIRVKETVINPNNESESKELHCQPMLVSDPSACIESSLDTEYSSNVYLRLRSSKEVAPILNLAIQHKLDLSSSDGGLAWPMADLQVNDDGRASGLTAFTNNEGFQRTNSFSSSSDESDDDLLDDDQTDYLISGPYVNQMSSSAHDYASVSPEDEESMAGTDRDEAKILHCNRETNDSIATYTKNEMMCRVQTSDLSTAPDHPVLTPASFVSYDAGAQTDFDGEGKKKSKTKVLNRVAKTVKSSTVITGKQVIKQSKRVGKATVNTGLAAGRAIPNAYKPPRKHEPGGRFSSKKTKHKSMKHIGRAIKNMEGRYYSETHSGQLTAPDLSREKISQILRQLSVNNSPSVSDALSSFVKNDSEQDLAFLRGCSAELGVIPLKAIDTDADYDCICARGIWEGRWREECCVIYGKDNHLALYAPQSRKPSLVVSFEEILSVRACDPKPGVGPLADLPVLSIDTTWRCHYLAFLNEADRDMFIKMLNDSMYHAEMSDSAKQSHKVAQEWESYKMSLETSLTGSGGKWASVVVGKKSKQKSQRMIFNSRRMAFDLEPVIDYRKVGTGNRVDSKMEIIACYVEGLLHKALSFSPEALDSADSSFLDEVSRLRCVPLHEIDYDSKQALCIFVNIYHCLLQHALLFAVDGLPDKRSVMRFKRCSCYEIGGDVFSLAELECCVIRGKLSKAVNIKTPFVGAAKKSRPFLQYALDAADNRVNFYLNTGSLDHPSEIPVLQIETLDHQIQAATSTYLMNQVEINVKKRVVIIPKVCDVYRNDFGMGDCLVCLSQILRYLDETSQLLIAGLLENGGQITVRFKQPTDKFHASLTERANCGSHDQLKCEPSV